MFNPSYPASFIKEADGGGLYVRFANLPEALTSGTDREDARREAEDCLAEAIAGRMNRGEDIPMPSTPKRGQEMIAVPLYLAPKLALYLTMREQALNNTQFARRLGVSETVVRRLLSPYHKSRAEKIQAALRVLGKRIVVTFEDAAA